MKSCALNDVASNANDDCAAVDACARHKNYAQMLLADGGGCRQSVPPGINERNPKTYSNAH